MYFEGRTLSRITWSKFFQVKEISEILASKPDRTTKSSGMPQGKKETTEKEIPHSAANLPLRYLKIPKERCALRVKYEEDQE